MPNVKFYVDERELPPLRDSLSALLPELRSIVCESLSVTPAACQLAVIGVSGLEDQASINTELQIMPRPERTPEVLQQLARRLRDRLSGATGLSVAVRMSSLDPETYVALK